ncbi:MAG TPA: hypothetical protein DD730_00775 [Desulfosporosinus sp.]|nr:hypothetical protein [Desulfosporosinus sp.]
MLRVTELISYDVTHLSQNTMQSFYRFWRSEGMVNRKKFKHLEKNMRNSRPQKHITIFICLLLIIFVASGCSNKSTEKASSSYDEVNNFLEENHANVDISNYGYNNRFSILDSDIDKNNIILAGETHAVAKNYELELTLLKHLNQKNKIRYLLAEMGYSDSCYINEYLETGDEAKLKLFYNTFEGTAVWSKESYDFWIELRKYNLTIPEDQRIQVVGIDIEFNAIAALDYLTTIWPSTAPPKEIKLAIEKYTSSYNLKSQDTITAIKNLQSDMVANPDIYNTYLGSKYFDVSIVIDNVVNFINASASNGANSEDIRELSMYSNLKRVYSHLPIGKYFGQFGMEHVFQRTCSSYMGDKTRFAMYLNSSDSPVKGKVLSIAYGYENCTFMNSRQNNNESVAESPIKDIDLLNKYSKSDTTIFKLNGDNSPFSRITAFVKGSSGGSTTDYFQYIILIKNSKGTIPLGKL